VILAYSSLVNGSRYHFQRIEAPRPVARGSEIAELGKLKKQYFKDNAELVKETKIVVDGVVGEDIIVAAPGGQNKGAETTRTRHLLIGRYYYVLSVESPLGKPLPDDATRFLSSLTFEAIVRASQAQTRVSPGRTTTPRSGSTAPRAPSSLLGRRPRQ
jgi:hypothetical protein